MEWIIIRTQKHDLGKESISLLAKKEGVFLSTYNPESVTKLIYGKRIKRYKTEKWANWKAKELCTKFGTDAYGYIRDDQLEDKMITLCQRTTP